MSSGCYSLLSLHQCIFDLQVYIAECEGFAWRLWWIWSHLVEDIKYFAFNNN